MAKYGTFLTSKNPKPNKKSWLDDLPSSDLQRMIASTESHIQTVEKFIQESDTLTARGRLNVQGANIKLRTLKRDLAGYRKILNNR